MMREITCQMKGRWESPPEPLAVWTFQKPRQARRRVPREGVSSAPPIPGPWGAQGPTSLTPQLNPQGRPGACPPSPPGLLRGTPGPPELPRLPSPSTDRCPSQPASQVREEGEGEYPPPFCPLDPATHSAGPRPSPGPHRSALRAPLADTHPRLPCAVRGGSERPAGKGAGRGGAAVEGRGGCPADHVTPSFGRAALGPSSRSSARRRSRIRAVPPRRREAGRGLGSLVPAPLLPRSSSLL